MIIVLQGRVLSTRLPAKGFFTFFDQTIWERMCQIALSVRGVDQVVFASGSDDANQLIRPYVERSGARWFVGSESAVLERFVDAIEGYQGEYLVRLTCDNYLAQPEAIEELVAATVREQADYGFIEPLSHYGGEVVKCSVLRRSFFGAHSALAAEHVTWDIRADPAVRKVALPKDYLGLDHCRSLTLDTVQDFITMKRLEMSFPGLRPVRCVATLRKAACSGCVSHAQSA